MVKWKDNLKNNWQSIVPIAVSILGLIIIKTFNEQVIIGFILIVAIGLYFLMSLSYDIDENKKDSDLKLKELSERQNKLEENLNIYSVLAEHSIRLKSLESNKIKR